MTKSPERFQFVLFSPYRYTKDAAAFATLWALLREPFVGAEHYDSSERPVRPMSSDPTEAFELISTELTLYVGGSRDGLLVEIKKLRDGIAKITIDLDSIDGPRGNEWIDWIVRLVGEMPVLFGFGCTHLEHDAKHHQIRSTPEGGYVRNWLGISMAEFQKYLPGLYWLTIFGPELTSSVDLSSLDSLPVTVTRLPGEQVAVRLNEPSVPGDMNARLEIEARIADALGPTLFFDRNRDLAFEHAPAVREALQRLKERK